MNKYFFGYLPAKWKRFARTLSLLLGVPSAVLIVLGLNFSFDNYESFFYEGYPSIIAVFVILLLPLTSFLIWHSKYTDTKRKYQKTNDAFSNECILSEINKDQIENKSINEVIQVLIPQYESIITSRKITNDSLIEGENLPTHNENTIYSMEENENKEASTFEQKGSEPIGELNELLKIILVLISIGSVIKSGTGLFNIFNGVSYLSFALTIIAAFFVLMSLRKQIVWVILYFLEVIIIAICNSAMWGEDIQLQILNVLFKIGAFSLLLLIKKDGLSAWKVFINNARKDKLFKHFFVS